MTFYVLSEILTHVEQASLFQSQFTNHIKFLLLTFLKAWQINKFSYIIFLIFFIENNYLNYSLQRVLVWQKKIRLLDIKSREHMGMSPFLERGSKQPITMLMVIINFTLIIYVLFFFTLYFGSWEQKAFTRNWRSLPITKKQTIPDRDISSIPLYQFDSLLKIAISLVYYLLNNFIIVITKHDLIIGKDMTAIGL